MPHCTATGSQTISITDGTYTANLNFAYTAPSNAPHIDSVVPASSNPKLKTILQINGNGFGSDLSAVSVFLGNSSGQIYQLHVKEVQDGVIKCGLPGGSQGNYEVQVILTGFGYAVPSAVGVNAFSYSFQIDSISPSSGSYYGGNVINIAGQNFLTG